MKASFHFSTDHGDEFVFTGSFRIIHNSHGSHGSHGAEYPSRGQLCVAWENFEGKECLNVEADSVVTHVWADISCPASLNVADMLAWSRVHGIECLHDYIWSKFVRFSKQFTAITTGARRKFMRLTFEVRRTVTWPFSWLACRAFSSWFDRTFPVCLDS